MRRVFSILISAVLLSLSFTQSASAEPGDAWMPSTQFVGAGKTSFFIAEDTQGNLLSTRVATTTDSNGNYYDYWCDTYSTKECSLNNDDVYFRNYATLPVCRDSNQENCVAQLVIKPLGKPEVKATFIRNVGGISFTAIPNLGLYEASTVSLWEAKGAPSQGGFETYAVNVRAQLDYNKWKGVFQTTSIQASVMPYREVTGPFGTPVGGTVQNAKGTKNPGSAIYNIDHRCVWNDQGKCGILQDFTPGTRVVLSSRLSKDIGGWFKGRMARPVISIQPFSKTNDLVVVDAESVDVSRLQVTVDKESAPVNIEDLYLKSGVMGPLWGGWQAGRDSSGDLAFEYLSTFRSYAKDISSGQSNLWSFGTVPNGQGSPCLENQSKVLGIVTTNALVFDGSAPEFDGAFMNYRVGGLHFSADGQSEVRGSYDLVLRSETARCLYGFTSAPISASVSVTNATGESKVATTAFSEKNGWVHVGAYGFTFSEPQLKVKLSQPKKATSKSKATQIVCVKATTVKKVTGSKPKCPKGFVRK